MIDKNVAGVQLFPNPAYAGEQFILKIKIDNHKLNWLEIKDITWEKVASKSWE